MRPTRSSDPHPEAVYASHLINTQSVSNGENFYVSDDLKCEYGVGRDMAIEITNSLRMRVDKLVFYIDHGYSSGMMIAKKLGEQYNIPMEERYLPKEMMRNL